MPSAVEQSVKRRLQEIERIAGRRVHWPQGCYPTTKAWLVFVGPSPGGKTEVETKERRWSSRRWQNKVYTEPDEWSTGFRISYRLLVSGIIGFPFETSGKLYAFANLHWNHCPKASAIPTEKLIQGLPDVGYVLRKAQPKVVVPLTILVNDLLIGYLEESRGVELRKDSEAEIADIPIPGKSGKRHPGLDAYRVVNSPETQLIGSLVVRIPMHPARIFSEEYAHRIASAMRVAVERNLGSR